MKNRWYENIAWGKPSYLHINPDLPVWPTLAAKDEEEREFTENIYVANSYCIFLMGGDWYTYLMVRKLLRIYVENI